MEQAHGVMKHMDCHVMEVRKREGGRESEGQGECEGEREEEKGRMVLISSLLCSC